MHEYSSHNVMEITNLNALAPRRNTDRLLKAVIEWIDKNGIAIVREENEPTQEHTAIAA